MTDLYVATDRQLSDLCGRLRGCEWLALDTEFMREKTYYPKLCLIQVATTDLVACVDPLTVDDIAPLLDVIFDETVTKVIHAATQDLEIFSHLRGAPPRPVFDTQIAATVLGYGSQVSYANLVETVLGVRLAKLHTRTDWSQRPLSPEQMSYAYDDVRYLSDLYRELLGMLNTKNRLDWLREDFAALSDAARYSSDPDAAWLRLRGLEKLKPVQRAVAQLLAAWREQRAQQLDRPRRWVIPDDVLSDIARRMPSSRQQLAAIRGLNDAALRRHGEAILSCVQRAQALPQSEWPRHETHKRLTDAQEAVVDAMTAVVKLRGLENAVSPSILATRKDLARLVQGEPDASVVQGWRRQLVGHDLEAFLAGRCVLRSQNGTLHIEYVDPLDSGTADQSSPAVLNVGGSPSEEGG